MDWSFVKLVYVYQKEGYVQVGPKIANSRAR